MSCPDPYRPYDPETPASSETEREADSQLPFEAEIRGLTRNLAARGGEDFAKDLALDLVLNQIVEQACLATGATGSAIALTRDGEMVCRATTGRNAPDLGVRLDNAGFSSDALRIGTLQRCDDTDTDPRVDSTACRLLGVRSILVVPLWYWGEFMGIFEIFSPRPNAFGERDEQTLQALAYRIVRHAKQATGTITGFTANPENVAVLTPKSPEPKSKLEPPSKPELPPPPVVELTPAKPVPQEPRDLWTMALASVAVLIAAAIVSLMVWRVGWASPTAKRSGSAPQVVQANSHPAAPVGPPTLAPHEEILTLDSSSLPQKSTGDGAAQSAPKPARKQESPSTPTKDSSMLGGLAIYDKNKLVYGTPIPDGEDSVAVKPLAKPARRRPVPPSAPALTTAVDASHVVQLKPEVADDLLTTSVEPEYPDAARRARVQGMVTLDTVIGADGKVQQASPVSGNSQLAEAAAVAVRQWRYKPYLSKGKPVPVRTQVSVQFMLAQ